MAYKPFLSPEEAANVMGVSLDKTSRMIRRGELAGAKRVRHQIRISTRALAEQLGVSPEEIGGSREDQ